MKGLIGKKIGMTRIFDDEGKSIPVTVIQTGNNVVHQVKSDEKDGYTAVQLGFGGIASRKLTKPMLGHFEKHNSSPTMVVKEFQLDSDKEELQSGQTVGVEVFEDVKFVDVQGTSKGRGHAGTVKKYNFTIGRKTHGNTNKRERGSSGAGTYPARVFPGLKMSGHMGAESVTVKRLKVAGIDKEAGLIYINGAVPGPNKGIVHIFKNNYKQQQ